MLLAAELAWPWYRSLARRDFVVALTELIEFADRHAEFSHSKNCPKYNPSSS
jgi:hypothetical protein